MNSSEFTEINNIVLNKKDVIDKTFFSNSSSIVKKQKNNLAKRNSSHCYKSLIILKKCIGDVWSEGTMHGLPRVINSKSWILKIMW